MNCSSCSRLQTIERLRNQLIRLQSGEEIQQLKDRVAELEALNGVTAENPSQSIPIPASVTQLLIRIDKLGADLAKKTSCIDELEAALADSEKKRLEQKKKADALERQLNTETWKHTKEVEELRRKHKKEMEELQKTHDSEVATKNKEIDDLKQQLYGRRKGEIIDQSRDGKEPTSAINPPRANSTNSSTPPSQDPSHPTIVSNNRTKSGKPVGGQIGHPHHPRKKLEPDETVTIGPPQEVIDHPDDYYAIGTVVKQRISLRLVPFVTEYQAVQYRNKKNLKCVHGEFPADLGHLEVNYDPSFEAAIAWLHSVGNMAYNKISELLNEATDGQVVPSEGMMARLESRFNQATPEAREKIAAEMLSDPVMNIDGTFVRVNGRLQNIIVMHTESGTFYKATGVKGQKGLDQTFAGQFHGITICDGETTFHKVGDTFQECLDHIGRYLNGSIVMEPWLTFSQKMHDLLWEAVSIRNLDKAAGNTQLDEKRLNLLYGKYDELIDLGQKEYDAYPPSDLYRRGYNTWHRLQDEGKEHMLLFLTDYDIPYTNNMAEKCAREVKVHCKINGGVRSMVALEAHCETMTILVTARQNGESTMSILKEGFEQAKANNGQSVESTVMKLEETASV